MNVEQIYKNAIQRPVMGWKGTLLTGVFLAPLIAAAASSSAHADNLQFTPSVEFGETFTDNVLLTPTNRQYDWVQSISPRLQITESGNRVDLNLTGGGDYLYFDRLNKDDLRPYLQGTTTIEAVPDLLKINGQALIQQTLIDPAGSFTVSQFNDTPNRQTLQIYSAGPSLYHHFGSFADAQLDYLFTYVNTDSTQIITAAPQNFLNGTYLHDVTFSLTSGDRFEKFTWDVTAAYNHSHTTAGNQVGGVAVNVRQINSLFSAGYQINSWFGLLADVGYDDLGNNANALAAGNFVTGGVVYHGGFQLVGPKSQVRFLIGQRYSDLSIIASVTHNFTSRTSLTASYSEEVTTSAARLAQLLGLAAQSDFATQFNLDPSFTLSDEQFLSRRGNVTLDVSRGKNTIGASAFAERRAYRILPLRDWVYGGSVNYSRQMNRKWTFDTVFLYTYQNFNNFVARQDDIYAAQIGLTNQFARSIKASLTYRLSYRSSTDPTFDVQENAVTLLLTTTF